MTFCICRQQELLIISRSLLQSIAITSKRQLFQKATTAAYRPRRFSTDPRRTEKPTATLRGSLLGLLGPFFYNTNRKRCISTRRGLIPQTFANGPKVESGKDKAPFPLVKPSAANKDTRNSNLAERESWRIQKDGLAKKFRGEAWAPRKKLSPDALDGVRALHAADPVKHSTESLAKQFQMSPDAIRRILKSKWRPSETEQADRQQRWINRGERVWSRYAAMGIKPPKQWRARGIVRTSPREDSHESGQGVANKISSRSVDQSTSNVETLEQVAIEQDRKRVGFGQSLSNMIF